MYKNKVLLETFNFYCDFCNFDNSQNVIFSKKLNKFVIYTKIPENISNFYETI